MSKEINLKDVYSFLVKIISLKEGGVIDLGAFKIIHLKDNTFKIIITEENITHVIQKVTGSK